MPRPPEIVRQFVEAAQLVRQLDRTGETVQQRRHRRCAGEDARQDFVVHARRRPRGHALARLFGGEGVGVVVVLIKGGPVGLFGQRAGGGAAFRQRFLRQRSQLAHQRGQFFDRRLVRRVAAFEDNDAFVLALLARPKAEARQIAGDGRHSVGRGLLRRITPRLVPRGEDPRVASRQHLVVGHAEEAVLPVQQGGVEDDLHGVLGTVVQPKAGAGVQDRVVDLVENSMSREPEGRVVGFLGGIARERPFVGAVVSVHDGAQGDDGRFARGTRAVQRRGGVEKQIDAFVAELVTPGDEEQAAVFRQRTAQQTADGGENFFLVGGGRGTVAAVIGNGAQAQTVRRHQVGAPAEKRRRLVSREGADRRETVGFARSGRFHGTLGGDVEVGGFARRVDLVHLGVNVASRPRHGASQHGGVSGEYR